MLSRVTRSWAAVTLAACLAGVGAGCAVPAPAGQSPPAAQLAGRQLAGRLVPVSALPRGYQLMKPFSQDSGSRLETAAAKYDLATMSCAAIDDDNGRPGFGESAFAEDAHSLNASGLPSSELLQQVYQFRAAQAASSFWSGLRAIYTRCPGLGAATAPGPGKVTQRVFAVPYDRGQAFEADVTVTGRPGGTVNTATLVVVADDDVFAVELLGYIRPVPADPPARTLMSELITRVQAAA
jgi:hypothetical protein